MCELYCYLSMATTLHRSSIFESHSLLRSGMTLTRPFLGMSLIRLLKHAWNVRQHRLLQGVHNKLVHLVTATSALDSLVWVATDVVCNHLGHGILTWTGITMNTLSALALPFFQMGVVIHLRYLPSASVCPGDFSGTTLLLA